MTRRIVLRPKVPDDLHSIVTWLEQHSVAVADRFVGSAFAAFDDLAAMPGKGSPKTYPRSQIVGVRSWPVPGFPNHLIYYQTRPDAIIVLAVLHGARNVRAVLKDRVP
jgi:plasmid stabilization system protein ParE